MPRLQNIRNNAYFIKAKKCLAVLILGILSFVIIGLGVFFLWVITGPRSLNSITPYLESALSSPAYGYKVKIESSDIEWDGWNNPMGMSINNVEAISDKGVVLSYFPKIILKIYVYELLIGKIDIKSLELIHPSATLTQNADGSIALGLNEQTTHVENSGTSVFDFFISDDEDNPLHHLKSFTVKHAELTIRNSMSQDIVQSQDTSLTFIKKHGKIKGTFVMPLFFGTSQANVFADFSLDKKNNSVGTRISWNDIPTDSLQQLFPSAKLLGAVHFPFSGNATIASDFSGHINTVDYSVNTGKGNIYYPEQVDGTINLDSAKITGSVADNLTTFKVSNAKIGIIGSNAKPVILLFNGIAHKVGDDFALDAYAETSNALVNDVHSLWPLALAPHVRKWVTTRITNGSITKADVTLHFKPGEIKLKDTPEQAINASIEIKNATVKYLLEHPEVSDVNAVVKFTGRTMDIKVSNARFMSASQISSADIRMPDMYPDDMRMFMDINVAAPAKDVQEFLALPRLDQSKKLGLTHDVLGNATGNVKLDFIAFSVHEDDKKHDTGDVNYSVDATLSDVSQNNFIGGRNIEKANMKLLTNNKELKVSGNAVINKVPMLVDLFYDIKSHVTQYTIKCDMPATSLPNFGLPTLDFVSGVLGVNAIFTESDTADKTNATIDLKNAGISLLKYGLDKKVGDPATLQLTTEKIGSGNTAFPSFKLYGTNIDLSGNGEYDKATASLNPLNFDSFHIGNTDMTSLRYQQTADGTQLTASGRAFDISPFLNGKKNDKDEGLNIDIKANKLIFGEKKEMDYAIIQADCGVVCRSVNVTAKLSDGTPFYYTVKGGQVSSASDNAGELLRVIGINDGIKGGKMTLTGKYVADNKIEGIFSMNNYSLNNAPILTKMLTIASLTGIIDTLAGNGITFTKLTAPFTYKDDVILLSGAKTHGPALGLTADGQIDNFHSTLDLNGVLIPSYTMNSLIGNVPLIGNLLMGGSGKGILGINYSIKGNMSDPSIRVNPLSAFTPGFLRDIFNIFDEPAPDIDKIIADRKNEEAKTANLPPSPTPTPAAIPVTN